jgi:hypothetical protein
MASAVDLSGLVRDIAEIVIEKTFNREELTRIHNIQTGIQMQEQIVFASQFGKTGILGDATCTRKTSAAESVLTQKYWNPAGIEDTITHCNKIRIIMRLKDQILRCLQFNYC